MCHEKILIKREEIRIHYYGYTGSIIFAFFSNFLKKSFLYYLSYERQETAKHQVFTKVLKRFRAKFSANISLVYKFLWNM